MFWHLGSDTTTSTRVAFLFHPLHIFFWCLARCLCLQFISLSYANRVGKFKTFSSPPRALENISAPHHHRTKPDAERINVHIFFLKNFFFAHQLWIWNAASVCHIIIWDKSHIYIYIYIPPQTHVCLVSGWWWTGRAHFSSARQIYLCLMSLRSVLSHFAVGEFHQ